MHIALAVKSNLCTVLCFFLLWRYMIVPIGKLAIRCMNVMASVFEMSMSTREKRINIVLDNRV